MRRVTCKDCHHSYDYDRDDFCPRCGSFNPPREAGSTKLERDLLSRFGDGRANQGRAGAGQAAREGGGSAQWKPQPKPDQGHASHTPVGGAACEETPRRGGGIAALVGLVLILGAVVYFSATGGGGLFPDPLIPTPAPVQQEYVEPWWGLGEAFPLNDVTVSVDGVWWAETEGSLLDREGYDLLLADVWIEGGGKRDTDTPITVPYLRLDDGTGVVLDNSPQLAKRLKEYCGVYAVDLRDYIWEDPLSGSFAFYVPEGTSHAVLCVDEAIPLKNGYVQTVTHNQIDLYPPIVG